MECLEKQDELEISRNLLELWSQGRDGDELGDVEEEGDDHDRNHMTTHSFRQV